MDYNDFQAGHTKENFWFKGKRFLIKELMIKSFGSRKDLKILNAGAGTGDVLEILDKFGKNYIIDINKKALSLVDKKLCKEKLVADVCNLPYKENFFDVVICSDVFEHIKKDKKAVEEIYRVLKKGGKLIFTVPAFQYLYSSHDFALKHYRRYNKLKLKELFSPFEKKEIFYWNSILFLPISLIRIIKKNSSPAVDKPNLPHFLNSFFTIFLYLDNFLIGKGFSPLFGLSLVGVCQK